MSRFVLVTEEENDEAMELPIEDDGTLLMSTLVAQFPNACGLRFRNPESNAWRGIRVSDDRLFPPEDSWSNYTYFTVCPKEKRKGEVLENPSAKTKRVEKKCSDLIVLGLPWKCTEEDLEKHFSQFGELLLIQVKRDLQSKQSKGFGFIRFADYDAQVRAMSQRHLIEGRWCDARIPNSQEGCQIELSQRIYVGRLTEDIKEADLRTYFSQFGEITEIFLPSPFRAFAFVTFVDAETAHNLYGNDHIIKGTSVIVSSATPKSADRFMPDYSNRMGGGAYGSVKVGQWQSLGSGSGGRGGGGRGRGGGRGSASQTTMLGAGDYSQQGRNMFQGGFPQLNPALVAAAQVALMGLMNSGAMPPPPQGIEQSQPALGPYGTPVSGQGGWNNSSGGQQGVGSNWNQSKSDGSGWN